MEPDPELPWWSPQGDDTWLLAVRVQPGASRTGAAGATGIDGAELKVRLASPPVDGRANDELIRWLAKELGVPRRAVELVRGQTSRSKQLQIDLGQRRDSVSNP